MHMKPLCFILMPFGVKCDNTGREIDFNCLYEELIKVAVEKADMIPVRADEELSGGIIHKPMIERLILCDYAVADLTTLNPNVFYELGLRHAIKGHTTIPIYSFDAEVPFDLKMQRILKYDLNKEGKLLNPDKHIESLLDCLNYCKSNKHADSPVFQLVEGFTVSHNLSHEKTDVFRTLAEYDNSIKDKLEVARNKTKEEVVAIKESLDPLSDKSAGVVADLFLSLRAVGAYADMIDAYSQMDVTLKKVKMIREQYALALNRIGERAVAEKVLTNLIKEYSNDPETNGLLGRVYKDYYKDYLAEGNATLAQAYLKKTIQSYKAGFDMDWRDAYPGVNLITMAYIANAQEIFDKYLPVVEFAAEQKARQPDYWDLATLAEISILKKDYNKAKEYLNDAITYIPDREFWMLESTLDNFRIIEHCPYIKAEDKQSISYLIEAFVKK